MFYYIISISGNNNKEYFQELSINGFPIETKNRKHAHKFAAAKDAHKFAAVFNSNLRAAYQINGVPAEKQNFYCVESVNDAVFTFFLSVTIESAEKENKIVLDVFRKKFVGTFEDAQETAREMIMKTPGVLRYGKIESLKAGISCLNFVDEYNFKSGEYTYNY